MTWFRVDDALHGHPKARAAGTRPMGLWVMSGAWSSAYLTDGYVSEAFVSGLAHGRTDADRLVAVGLWHPLDSGGWQFHEWDQSNPTRAEVEFRREVERARKAEWRAMRNGRVT